MRQDIILFTAALLLLSTCVVQGRIVGGGPATDGEYPFYAHSYPGTLCGGTLVHKDIVLTAAHCVSSFSVGKTVYIGAINIFGTGDETNRVKQIYQHPDFTELGENDIMLVKLEKPSSAPLVNLNRDAATPLTNAKVDAIGFGLLQDPIMPTASLSASLQEVQLTVQDFQVCSVGIPGIQYERTQVCAGETSSKGVCFGDSGGPLLGAGSNVQVGLVSYGNSCTRPAIFTRVSAYIDFIEDAICEMSSDPPARCSSQTVCLSFVCCDLSGFI